MAGFGGADEGERSSYTQGIECALGCALRAGQVACGVGPTPGGTLSGVIGRESNVCGSNAEGDVRWVSEEGVTNYGTPQLLVLVRTTFCPAGGGEDRLSAWVGFSRRCSDTVAV